MGKRIKLRKSATLYDSDDDEDHNNRVISSSAAMSELTMANEAEQVHGQTNDLDECLDALYEKRGATREKALSTIVDAFRNKLQYQFVANKCITLLHQCLNSLKKGSSKEIQLVSTTIGLLAITVGFVDGSAHEILEDTITPFSLALKPGLDSLKTSSMLECLAVITFMGGNCPEETERSMQIMWQFIHPKSGSNVGASKTTGNLLADAISAWAFLLTTVEGLKVQSKDWQEPVSYLSTLLEKDDKSIRIAAGEAIALMFEIGNLKKFLSEAKVSDAGSHLYKEYLRLNGLREKILNQVRGLAGEAGGKGAVKKDLHSQKNLFRDVLEFIEDGYSPETSVKVGGDTVNTSTWCELIQMNFLKRFLAGGFAKHMLENVVLHDVFGFTPKKKKSSGSGPRISNLEKKMYMSPNSVQSKARTQYMQKQHMLSRGRNAGHYSTAIGDEDL